MANKGLQGAALCVAVLLLASCATAPNTDAADTAAPREDGGEVPVSDTAPESPVTSTATSTTPERPADQVVLGTGDFVQAARGPERAVFAGEDGVTLNFEKAPLHEFLRVIFDTILKQNYVVDPSVIGTVTLHTTRPITAEAVLPTVETVLELNNAALIYDDGVYRVLPLAAAPQASRSPAVGRYSSGNNVGYGYQVVPLQFASATEIEKILTPFLSDGTTLSVDAARNVLILGGPRYRLEELLATVRTFDVDWLKGMSFAMFRLDYADAATMVDEIEQVIGTGSGTPLAGIVKLLPIERLNAVLVITHAPGHIASVRALIEQFDLGVEGSGGRRLFVYEVENGKAESIANALQQIFGTGDDETGATRQGGLSADSVFRPAESVTSAVPPPGTMNVGQSLSPVAPGESDGIASEQRGDIKVIADTDNNSILVLASQEDYRSIEAAIRRLDVAPRQVLIEATIAEVSLSNNLNYGVRWFLERSNFELGFNAPVPGTAAGEGLAFAFLDDASSVSAFFDVLEANSNVKFLSTPQVMVLDNQTANMRVGDQIPVTTRSSQSTNNPDAPIVTEVQYRDTGTLLTVTPRINAGGQVTLEISQEVSLPGTSPAVGGSGNVSIAQRTINSSVTVMSGQTVVLGGLILESATEGKTGVPVLMDIPLLGALFSTNTQDVFRTELIITVKPLVVTNDREMRRVTEELRQQLSNANDFERQVKESRLAN
ncbi:MAG: type II secretion system secretin GspD [Gammaproteobacteria bacterium]|jgi:general secretion pathway protein D|nr:type II secretion system secretin GspD [Gammaproteobacteria bacterium]